MYAGEQNSNWNYLGIGFGRGRDDQDTMMRIDDASEISVGQDSYYL
jgi:hypothetical protein